MFIFQYKGQGQAIDLIWTLDSKGSVKKIKKKRQMDRQKGLVFEEEALT